MKIRFLGTSAATSFPLAFCNCRVCKAARDNRGKDLRRRSSLLVNSDLLLDLGPDSVAAALQYSADLTEVRYLLQTHAHSDHFDAGHFITRYKEYATENVRPLLLAASKNTLERMDQRLKEEEPACDLFDEKWQQEL